MPDVIQAVVMASIADQSPDKINGLTSCFDSMIHQVQTVPLIVTLFKSLV
jgi:hypothetical protein